MYKVQTNSHTPSRQNFFDFSAMAMNTNENNLVYDGIYKTNTDKFYLHPNNFSIKWRDYSHTPSRQNFFDFSAMAMNTNENNLVYDGIYKTNTDKFYLHPNNFSIKWRDYFSFFYNMF